MVSCNHRLHFDAPEASRLPAGRPGLGTPPFRPRNMRFTAPVTVARLGWSLLLGAISVDAPAQQPNPPGQVKAGATPKYEAYLFAHMMHRDYGRLYYSVSLDGLHWRALNAGKRVLPEYRGHPDICRGHDGRYYLVGNDHDTNLVIRFWVSDDLVTWTRFGEFTPDLSRVPDYPNALPRVGAPKLFYDDATRQYLLSWHTPHVPESREDPEAYWASQRTFCVTSPDLKTFSTPPVKLLPWDMGTIDVIVRRVGSRYYAILKDERYPTLDWPTGKTIRIASAHALLGPYEKLSPPISPNFREAPTLIPSPDGSAWYLYYEQYPGVAYGVSVAARLEGPWYQLCGYTFHADWDKYSLPPRVRHGSMIPISRREYDRLLQAFPPGETAPGPERRRDPSALQ